jgi:hypothetical protein
VYRYSGARNEWKENKRAKAHTGVNSDTSSIRYSRDGTRIVTSHYGEKDSNWKIWSMPAGLFIAL